MDERRMSGKSRCRNTSRNSGSTTPSRPTASPCATCSAIIPGCRATTGYGCLAICHPRTSVAQDKLARKPTGRGVDGRGGAHRQDAPRQPDLCRAVCRYDAVAPTQVAAKGGVPSLDRILKVTAHPVSSGFAVHSYCHSLPFVFADGAVRPSNGKSGHVAL